MSCGVGINYSMTGTSTAAQTISISEFYNNTDLGPANLGQTFTNQLKNYIIQNSNLAVVAEEGEVQCRLFLGWGNAHETRDLEAMVTDGRYDSLSKKEIARAEKEKRKLLKNLEGIRQMSRLPDAIFVVDTKKERIAVDEARKLKIPVIGIVDTNCDPDEVDFVIPGNDDALRAIRLFAAKIADAVVAGRGIADTNRADDASDGGDDRGRRSRPNRPAPRAEAATTPASV